MYSFPDLEPVCCSMSSSNCCFLTCIQISQEAGQVVWYSLKIFPQFVVIHTVKGFGVVNKAKVDVFLELSCFFDDPADIGNLIFSNQETSYIITKILLLFYFIFLLFFYYFFLKKTHPTHIFHVKYFKYLRNITESGSSNFYLLECAVDIFGCGIC